MDKAVHCRSIQVVDGDGTFSNSRLESFTELVELHRCGVSYAVVSIMGPQSSGKSTLLNHLFGTNFQMMDTYAGRSQTTKGIWLAKAVDVEPLTLVMDLEGNDGVERGEDDLTFEAQSALFALAISDVVIINMWCHDIGRDKAANRPLLKIVFQEMMRIFTPRKTTLMFVIRDISKTPLDLLKPKLREDAYKIWDSIPKPQEHQKALLHEFFNIEVVGLSSYEYMEDQFKEQVACLKKRFFHSITPGGLAGDRSRAVPGSGFSLSASQIWKDIKKDKNLDLSAHKIAVAALSCEEIADEKYSTFQTNEEWCQIEMAARSELVPALGKKLDDLIDNCLEGYGSDAIYYDEGIASAKRKQLEEKLIRLVEPAFQSVLRHLRSKIREKFRKAFDKALAGGEVFSSAAHYCTLLHMTQFDKGCADALTRRTEAKWDTLKVKEELQRDIDAHIAKVREVKLSEQTRAYEGTLYEALSEPVRVLLNEANAGTWPAIRKLLQRETESAVSGLSSVLIGFGVEAHIKENMITSLRDYATDLVEAKAKEKAKTVVTDMTSRFLRLFDYDDDLNPRIWTADADFHEISEAAFSASLQLLSVVAAIHLDDEVDNIYNTLKLVLLNSDGTSQSITPEDTLASRTWLEVPSSKTLIMPVECPSLWRQFKAETEHRLSQGRGAWESAKKKREQEKVNYMIATAAAAVGVAAMIFRRSAVVGVAVAVATKTVGLSAAVGVAAAAVGVAAAAVGLACGV